MKRVAIRCTKESQGENAIFNDIVFEVCRNKKAQLEVVSIGAVSICIFDEDCLPEITDELNRNRVSFERVGYTQVI